MSLLSINKLKENLEKNKTGRIFWVTGNKSFNKCKNDNRLRSIIKSRKSIFFNDFTPNPNEKDLKKGCKKFLSKDCEEIVAVGGGSVIDMAKLILYKSNTKNKDKIKFHVIPTTAGSGSEATNFAVLYKEKIKHSIQDDIIKPDYVYFDVDYLLSNSNYQIACSGFDAFAQAIESYWSVNSNAESEKNSLRALTLILGSIEDSYKGDKGSLNKLYQGSYLAGKAINVAKTTAAHAFAYSFTSNYGLPHGHAVAMTLSFFYKKFKDLNEETCQDDRGLEFVRSKISKLNEIFDEFNTCIQDIIDTLNLDINPSNFFIRENEIENVIINKVNYERLKNYPMKFNLNELRNYFKSFYEKN